MNMSNISYPTLVRLVFLGKRFPPLKSALLMQHWDMGTKCQIGNYKIIIGGRTGTVHIASLHGQLTARFDPVGEQELNKLKIGVEPIT